MMLVFVVDKHWAASIAVALFSHSALTPFISPITWLFWRALSRRPSSTASDRRPPRTQAQCSKDGGISRPACQSVPGVRPGADALANSWPRGGCFIFNPPGLLTLARRAACGPSFRCAVGRADLGRGGGAGGVPTVRQVGIQSTPSVEASGRQRGHIPDQLAPLEGNCVLSVNAGGNRRRFSVAKRRKMFSFSSAYSRSSLPVRCRRFSAAQCVRRFGHQPLWQMPVTADNETSPVLQQAPHQRRRRRQQRLDWFCGIPRRTIVYSPFVASCRSSRSSLSLRFCLYILLICVYRMWYRLVAADYHTIDSISRICRKPEPTHATAVFLTLRVASVNSWSSPIIFIESAPFYHDFVII